MKWLITYTCRQNHRALAGGPINLAPGGSATDIIDQCPSDWLEFQRKQEQAVAAGMPGKCLSEIVVAFAVRLD